MIESDPGDGLFHLMTRILEFPTDRILGYLHGTRSQGLLEFHGRFKKLGGMAEDVENHGWRLIGEARGRVELEAEEQVLLEVLPEEARDLRPLRQLPADGLEGIWLGNTFVDDEQLACLSELTALKWIDVQNNGEVTDAGIAHWASWKSLRSFGAHWTRIGEASLEWLASLSDLRYVDIWGCEIDAEAVERFRKRCPECAVRTE